MSSAATIARCLLNARHLEVSYEEGIAHTGSDNCCRQDSLCRTHDFDLGPAGKPGHMLERRGSLQTAEWRLQGVRRGVQEVLEDGRIHRCEKRHHLYEPVQDLTDS